MENGYNNFFYSKVEKNEDLDSDFADLITDKPKKEDSIEEFKKEEPKPKKKSAKTDKVIYATKEVKINGIVIPKGYSKVSEETAEEVIKHPKVRIASEQEIKTYL